MPLTPEEEAELQELESDPQLKSADQDHLASMISPDYEPVPQVLATLPSTNHPQGERGAESAWMRKPQGESKGAVFVYEPTLLSVKKRLMEDPQFNSGLFSTPLTPERIAGLTPDSSEVGAAKAKWWQETADAAGKAGKVAYRYSFTPWLQGAKEMGALQMLKGSLNPASEGAQAFVMGADDTALFGAVRASQEAENPQVQGSAAAAGIEHSGGVQPGSAVDYNAEVQAEHPWAYGAGQALGLLNPISLGGRLFELLGKAGQSAAKVAGRGALGLGARTAAAAGAAAAGAGAHQAVSEGVDAASSMARTGTPGTTLGAAAGRVQEAATDPLNAALGAGGHVVSEAAGGLARGIAGSGRFRGRIERVENLGGEVKFGKGPTMPGADEAIAAGKARDVSPEQPIAERIAPEMSAAVRQRHESTKLEIKDAQEAYYPTREGQMRLPVTETLQETKRAILQPQGRAGEGGKLEVVDPQARARDVNANRIFFNQQVSGVSLTPVNGAIELTAEEADAILTPHWKAKLLGNAEPPVNPPPSGGAPGKATKAAEAPAAGAKLHPSDQRAEDVAKLMETHQGHITKAQAKQKLGFQGMPEYEFDKLVKEGRLEKVPPGEKQFGQVDAEYRVPKSQQGTTPPKGQAKKPAGAVAGKPQRDVTPTNEYPASNSDRNEYGERTRPYREAQRADNVRAANLADESGIPGVSSGTKRPSMAEALKGKKVYVAPKRYTAAEHEELIRGRQNLASKPDKPGARDAKRIYEAAFKDRDKRPLDGVEGGWSAMQRRHHEMLNAVEQEGKLVSPDGTPLSTQEQLAKYARQQSGELPRLNAMADVGKRAGVGDELRLIRGLEPLGALREQGALHKPSHAAPPTTLYGALSAGAEALTLRGLYPGLKSLGGPGSPIRGGRAGRAGMVDLRGTSLDDEKEKRP